MNFYDATIAMIPQLDKTIIRWLACETRGLDSMFYQHCHISVFISTFSIEYSDDIADFHIKTKYHAVCLQENKKITVEESNEKKRLSSCQTKSSDMEWEDV